MGASGTGIPAASHASSPKTRKSFWKKKLEDNVARDKRNKTALRELGWRVMVIWQCEIEGPRGGGSPDRFVPATEEWREQGGI